MNTEIQSAIIQNISWASLPAALKQSLGNSQKEYEKSIVSFSITNQLRYRENLIKDVYKDEKKYYEDLLAHSRNNLMLFPYHLADVIVKGLRITPFQYYISIIESMMDNDKSYDSIPNFTAIDCLRLLGIGRNEYIELMNQCRSGKKLFRRKSVCKNLLPVKPVKVTVEPWWLVQNGFVTDEDIKFVSEEEKILIDFVIDHGGHKAGMFDYDVVQSLYRKGLIYLDIPIYDNDYIYVSTLEGFVMNRVMGDYLEKLLYKILVSIDQQTSVGELATLLQIDANSVKKAVALFCRLNLAKKKNVAENTHPSWNEIRGSSETNSGHEKKDENSVAVDDPLLKELNDALAETSQYFKESSDVQSNQQNYDIMDSPPSTQKRIAFFFDSTLTAFLMMGNLSPDLKKHAVKMFEAGKLTNEDLDEFLNELKNVSSVRDESEGEAKRYFDHALILRETVLALKSNSTKLIDLIRCESLLSLDQEIERFLTKNYFLLVSMAPLSKEVKPIVCPSLPHLGPPALAVNSLWFKLFLYEMIGCGPPSILFPRGTRVRKIPKIFHKNCDRILLTSWGHEPASLPISNMLFALNDALLYSPVLIQSYGSEELSKNTCILPFPLKRNAISETGLEWSLHDGVRKLNEILQLNHSCGYLTLLQTNNHKHCVHYLDDVSDIPVNGVTSEENCALLQEEVDKTRNMSDGDKSCELRDAVEKPSTSRNVKLLIPSNVSKIDDWCILDCIFGVPLFDSQLNSTICNSIEKDGLWLPESLQKLIEVNNKLADRLEVFIQQQREKNSFDDDFPNPDKEVPWPVVGVVFNNGKLSKYTQD